MQKKTALTVLALCALAAGPAGAGPAPGSGAKGSGRISSILYVGNSFFYYNDGISTFVSGFSEGSGEAPKLSGTLVTISGSGLEWHDLNSYFRPHAIGSYSFSSDNEIVFNTRAKLFDAVVMMDCSQCPIHPKLKTTFFRYAKKDAEIARRHGAQPLLFMSWAYKNRPEMTGELAAAYTEAGRLNHERVIPAGLAFARVREERPDIELYAPDLRHPSLAGSYLAGAVVYASLTGRDLEGDTYTAGLDPSVAAYLRSTASRVASAYQTR